MSVLDILADKKLITRDDIARIKEEVKRAGGDLDAVLERRGVSTEDILASKAEYLGIPFRNLEGRDVPFDILKYVPEESAVYYRFVPIGLKDGVLEVGIVDPDNIEARDALNFISTKIDLPFKLFIISEKDFSKVVESYKGLSGEVTKALSELETELSGSDELVQFSKEKSTGEMRIIEDAPVTKIVATILHYATEGEASDIHIEHMGDKVRVRFRVDGVLNTSLILPVKVYPAVVARIKILSNMRLDEKRKPQDGRFSAKIEGRKIDFRVSTFPAYYGEKVEIRILDTDKGVKPLDKMGLSPRNLKLIRDSIKRPYGLILISGPTGSGKSTTLYSMLNELDREGKNVLSLEDPVEYNIPGMSQSQVRPEIGYTFANGLRSTLRQDPDIIMVGEIRDKETALLAVQAALTGHLVLSTIHTNNAVGVIPRLIDMGVDPYLIAPTLILAIAQRLVSLLCPGSGKPVPVADSLKAMIEKDFEGLPSEFRKEVPFADTVNEISPTADCPKGTRGRMAVFEILQMSKELEAVILKTPTEAELIKVARRQGMLTFKEDALIKAFRKEIPIEEVNKL
ncbi:MAG: Flp pilus assembly complex ATPase component TadA [Candidatus Taylorbacteria bacterium]|nr:Flp pilus assembly complex ATPase component TadA [Candidatus Taylorbacteria bacterium]